MIYQDMLDRGALEQYAAALNARAGRAGASGRLCAAGLRDRILESGGRCEWCAVSLVNAEFELDHVLSLKQGGANAAGNLVVSCPDCNRRKGRKHPARFAAETGSSDRTRDPLNRPRVCPFRHGSSAGRNRSSLTKSARLRPAVEARAALTEIPPYIWTD